MQSKATYAEMCNFEYLPWEGIAIKHMLMFLFFSGIFCLLQK